MKEIKWADENPDTQERKIAIVEMKVEPLVNLTSLKEKEKQLTMAKNKVVAIEAEIKDIKLALGV